MADLSDFQLKEYENISQAHFKTNEVIVAFFRYYLLIVALPIPLIGTLFGVYGETDELVKISGLQFPVAAFALGVAVLGFFIMCYLTGLRCEAILYAKTVNLVRGYFLRSGNAKVQYMLPITAEKPEMAKSRDHIYIVLSFAVIDSLYAVSAVALFSLEFSVSQGQIQSDASLCSAFWLIGSFCLSVAAHVGAHKRLCRTRNAAWSAKSYDPDEFSSSA